MHHDSLKGRWLIFSILASLYFFVYFFRTSPAVIASDLMEEFSAGAAIIGLMSSTYFYSYAAAQLPVGVLADTIGSKKTVGLFASITLLGTLIFALSPDVTFLSIGRALIGFGGGGIFVPTQRILTRWFRTEEFARMNGLLISIGTLGALVSSAPLALLVSITGWRNSFLIVSTIIFLLILLNFSFVRDDPPAPLHPQSSVRRERVSESLRKVLRNRNFRVLFMTSMITYGVMMGFQGLCGVNFFIDVYGIEKEQGAMIIMMISIGVIFGSPLGGTLSDKLGRRKIIYQLALLGMILSWIPFSVLFGRAPLFLYYPLCFLFGFFNGVAVIFQTIGKESFPKDNIATGLATLNMAAFIGAALLQGITGYLIELGGRLNGGYSPQGYQITFLFYLAVLSIVFILSFFVVETRRSQVPL
ncbi:MAG: MFS transporter [Archaeoglobi archaeon]|nr:MFS transporter [Candidatus Mnemosynella bozhongmuii]